MTERSENMVSQKILRRQGDTTKAKAWFESGRGKNIKASHALLLIFQLRPKQRITVGMKGDTLRLKQLEKDNPGIWESVEKLIISERYVRPQHKQPLDDGSNPVTLDTYGYGTLRMMGYLPGDEFQERMFRKDFERRSKKPWREYGESPEEQKKRLKQEAKSQTSAPKAPHGHIPKGAKIANTPNGRRIRNILRLFIPDSNGIIHAQRGPTDAGAHQLMSHAMLGELIGKGYVRVEGPKGTGRLMLCKKGIQLLTSAQIRVKNN